MGQNNSSEQKEVQALPRQPGYPIEKQRRENSLPIFPQQENRQPQTNLMKPNNSSYQIPIRENKFMKDNNIRSHSV